MLPWMIFEYAMGTATADAYWMPVSHMAVFLLVVFVYDWMSDHQCEVNIQCSKFEPAGYEYAGDRQTGDGGDDDDARCLV